MLLFDAGAAAHFADTRAPLERQGQTIGACDLMIAGHARSRGLVVVAGHPGECHRVDGLRAEDWRTS
jgi:tRNA(fMet)-specific endonuclease VapC